MRARYMVRGKHSPPQNDSSIPCSHKKPSTWKAPKTNSADLEAILSTVEKELFINIKANYVKDNLTKDERRSLTTWRRDVLTLLKLMTKKGGVVLLNLIMTLLKSSSKTLNSRRQMDLQ